LDQFYASGHGGYKPSCKGCIKTRSQAWRIENQEQRRSSAAQYRLRSKGARNARNRERIATDPAYALRNNIRTSLFKAMADHSAKKAKRAEAIIGCTWPEFVVHMERQFTKGMSWANRGEWHIDHIIPLATAQGVEDVMRLNHYTNLRPLWGAENIAKADKVLTLL
jgi:hypothetical protein